MTILGKKTATRRSFTLIEMVVAIVLLVMMAGALGMQLKGMLDQHAFFSQVTSAKRAIERGVRMAKLLDTEMDVYFYQEEGGLKLELRGISRAATELAGERSEYSRVEKVLVNGQKLGPCEAITFSSSFDHEPLLLDFVSKKGKVSSYTIKAARLKK